MYELDKGTNGVYSLNYHFITCVKYRQKVFTDDKIIERLKDIIIDISQEFDVKVIEQECGEDHLHLLFRCKPTLIFKDYIQALKGRSARLLRKEFPDLLKHKLCGDHFWSSSYFLATSGNVTLDVLMNYIQNQRTLQES